MNDNNKVKAKNSLALLTVFSFLILTYSNNSFAAPNKNFHSCLTASLFQLPVKDTPVIKKRANTPNIVNKSNQFSKNLNDTTPAKKTDSSRIAFQDTVDLKISRDTLTAPVYYHADDSMVIDVPAEKIYLYGKISSVKYLDNNLEAPHIEYDSKTSLVKAHLTKDSLGQVISYAAFNQGTFQSVNDSIVFNMKTGKGLTKGTYTKQNEMFVYGEKIKKASVDVFFALNARLTTCNLDTPHFAFVSKHIKFITNKMAFTGPVHPEFEGVPIPIVLPFGIFPLMPGRHSGFLAPSFTANDQMGLSLEGIGYYKILSDNWDVVARGTLYSYGGYNLNVNPRYFKRYRYQGSFNLAYTHYKILDVPANNTMKINWSHNSDNKARPGVTFRAYVDAGSSKFNEQQANRPDLNFQTSLSSSISYSKNNRNKPFSYTISATHDQNTQQRRINLNLPDINFDVQTQYPFRRKEAVSDYKWYENIGIALHTNAKSRTFFYDTLANIGNQITENLKYGASHDVPISLSLPSLGVIQVSPGISYREVWYQRQDYLRYNGGTKKVDTLTKKGFFAEREMSFSLSLATRIFGMYGFKPGKRINAIRHEIRPSVSISYKPDLNGKDYYQVQLDSSGRKSEYYSIYQNSIHGAFGQGQFGGLSFSIDNNVTMKVRDRKDTSASAMRKVTILQSLRLDGSYNFLLDSFKLSNLSLNANTNLFDKFNISAFANFDPYQVDAFGRRIDKLIYAKKPYTLGTLTSAQISMATSFKGGESKAKQEPGTPLENPGTLLDRNGMPLNEYQQEAAYIRNNPGEFVDFSIPWSIDFNYSLRYSQNRDFFTNQLVSSFNQDVNINASVNLSPKWKIGGNGFYNITTNEIGSVSMYLSREMHCWQMAINISPVGKYRFFSINISPKSSLLRDLKINRTRSFIDL